MCLIDKYFIHFLHLITLKINLYTRLYATRYTCRTIRHDTVWLCATALGDLQLIPDVFTHMRVNSHLYSKALRELPSPLLSRSLLASLRHTVMQINSSENTCGETSDQIFRDINHSVMPS